MTSSIKKGKKLYNEQGFSRLVQAGLFKFLAKCFHVPSRKIAVFNGVAIRGASLSSKIDIFPEHEAEYLLLFYLILKNLVCACAQNLQYEQQCKPWEILLVFF